MFLRKGFPKIYSKFTGKHPYRSVISIKLQSNFARIVSFSNMQLCLNSIQEGEPEDSIARVAVSCDETWKRRGHSLLNGIITIISADTGTCLECHVMSKHCDACNYCKD